MNLHWKKKPDGFWWILIQPITFLPVKLGCSLKHNYSMSPNFFFTFRRASTCRSWPCPALLSTLSDPVWIAATDSPHVNTASGAWLGFWFIPRPLSNFTLMTRTCWLLMAGWNIALLPGSWCQLQMPGLTRGPLTLIGTSTPSGPSGAFGASASQVIPRTRLRDSPPLRASELASQLLHPPLHLPRQQRDCLKLSWWDAGASCWE